MLVGKGFHTILKSEVKRAVNISRWKLDMWLHFGSSEIMSLIRGILLFLSLSIPANGQGELA